MEQDDKKLEILKSAGECFARYGYEKTTLDDIGKPVGLNKASLYHYYKNKESIFVEVISSEAASFLGTLKEKIAGIKDCQKKIFTYLDGRFEYIQKAINLNKLSFETASKHKALFAELLENIFKMETGVISEILDDCKKNGIIADDCDTNRTAGAILTMSDAIKTKTFKCSEWNFNENTFDYSLIREEVKFSVSLILNGIRK